MVRGEEGNMYLPLSLIMNWVSSRFCGCVEVCIQDEKRFKQQQKSMHKTFCLSLFFLFVTMVPSYVTTSSARPRWSHKRHGLSWGGEMWHLALDFGSLITGGIAGYKGHITGGGGTVSTCVAKNTRMVSPSETTNMVDLPVFEVHFSTTIIYYYCTVPLTTAVHGTVTVLTVMCFDLQNLLVLVLHGQQFLKVLSQTRIV